MVMQPSYPPNIVRWPAKRTGCYTLGPTKHGRPKPPFFLVTSLGNEVSWITRKPSSKAICFLHEIPPGGSSKDHSEPRRYQSLHGSTESHSAEGVPLLLLRSHTDVSWKWSTGTTGRIADPDGNKNNNNIYIFIYIHNNNNHKNNLTIMMIMHEDQNQKWCHKFMSLSK